MIGGIVATSCGVFVLLVSLGVIKTDGEAVHATIWMLGIVGLVFLFAGFSMFAQRNSLIAVFFVFLLLCGMAMTGTYIALRAEHGSLQGGIPFLSEKWNLAAGRVIFVIGSFITWVIAILA